MLPNDALVQYHFGMASSETGDKAASHQALETALKLSPQCPGREEAQKTWRS